VIGLNNNDLQKKLSMTAKGKFNLLDLIARKRIIAIIGLTMLIVLIISIQYPINKYFWSVSNFQYLLLGMSVEQICVVAMAMLLIIGEIDLSMGWNFSWSGVFCTWLIQYQQVPIAWAIIIAITTAVVCGYLTGVLIAKLKVVSFITTLATGFIYYGFALIITESAALQNFPKEFNAIAQGSFLGLEYPVWYAAIITVIFIFLVKRTRFFRQIYYIGQNKDTAQLSGMKVDQIKIALFTICATLSAIAGIIFAARSGSMLPITGQGMEMKAIIASILGGVSFLGGMGTILGATLGEFFMSVLNNFINLGDIPTQWQRMIIGLVMILAVIVDAVFSKRKIKIKD
jgi:ribose transport system permease protein